MQQLIGILALVVAVVFSLCVAYCVWMGLTANLGWLLVGLGVLLSDLVAIAIAYTCLKVA